MKNKRYSRTPDRRKRGRRMVTFQRNLERGRRSGEVKTRGKFCYRSWRRNFRWAQMRRSAERMWCNSRSSRGGFCVTSLEAIQAQAATLVVSSRVLRSRHRLYREKARWKDAEVEPGDDVGREETMFPLR